MTTKPQGVAQRVIAEINDDLHEQWRAMVWGENSGELLEGAERMHHELSREAREILRAAWEGDDGVRTIHAATYDQGFADGALHLANRLGLDITEPEETDD